ncbi:MAG: DUF4007 family protein [Paludibacteraceae bacterium]|nr:DUF4007 family protein [Paludibacteraceae bacterium]
MDEIKKFTFSGHESFPCKTLWLKKGYDFITNGGDFNADEAVVRLGVGKNMVSSIRYWIKAFGFNNERTNWIAEYIFDTVDGKDPFVEDIGTLWLLHFLLIYTEEASLYNLFFVDFQKERREFDRSQVVSFVKRKMAEAGKDTLFNENTVKKDVGVLLLNYCLPKNPQSNEDFSTLLMDLDLLRQMERRWSDGEGRDRYVFNIEGKRQIVPEIFLFAILMMKDDTDKSISYDMMQELGLIFCMNDLEVIDMLKLLSEKYSDSLAYSDVAGIRQLQFINKIEAKQILDEYYE